MVDIIIHRHMNIGTGAAESEDYLTESFYETDEYKKLLDFENKQTILLGRTGSGKTALIKMLHANKNISSIEINPDNFVIQYIRNNSFIQEMKSLDINLSVYYKFLWLHEIISGIIKHMFPDNESASFWGIIFGDLNQNKNIDELKKYLQNNDGIFFKPATMENIVNGLDCFIKTKLGNKNIAEISTGIGSEQKRTIQSQISMQLNNEHIRNLINTLCVLQEYFGTNTRKKIVVTIDDLDKDWANEDCKYDLLNALQESILMFKGTPNIKIVISLRSDMLAKTIEVTEKQPDKSLALTIKLHWTREMLSLLVDKKLEYVYKYQYKSQTPVTFKTMFACKVGDMPGNRYIMEKIFLRPRDIISFVNFVLTAASVDGARVEARHIIEAESKYRTYLIDALKYEWKSLFPNIDIYLKSVRELFNDAFSFSEIFSKYEMIQNTLLDAENIENDKLVQAFLSCNKDSCRVKNIQNLLNALFTSGILGKIEVNNIIYSDNDSPKLGMFDFDDCKFQIHPIFRKMDLNHK